MNNIFDVYYDRAYQSEISKFLESQNNTSGRNIPTIVLNPILNKENDYSSFLGQEELHDLILIISQHKTEILFGVFGNFIYDCLKIVFNTLRQISGKKDKSKSCIRIEINGKTLLDCQIDNSLTEDEYNLVMGLMPQFYRKNVKELQKANKPKCIARFNKVTQEWEFIEK